MLKRSTIIRKLFALILAVTVICSLLSPGGRNAYADEALSVEIVGDNTFYAGDSLYVKASGDQDGSKGAWVGLYKKGEVPGSGVYALRSYDVSTHEGKQVNIMNTAYLEERYEDIVPGEYAVHLFGSNEYDIVKTIDITLTQNPDASQDDGVVFSKVLREPGCLTFGLEYVTYADDTSEYREIPSLGGHLWAAPVHIEGSAAHRYACQRNDKHVKMEACSSAGGKVSRAATVGQAGVLNCACDKCGGVYTVSIPAVREAPTLSADSLTYNGKAQKPSVNAIVDTADRVIDKSIYTITYPKSSKAVGRYTVTVSFKDRYAGTYKLSYTICPKKVALKKLTGDQKSLKATWYKASAQTSGYQISCATNKSFKRAKITRVKGVKKTSAEVKKLKGKTKYFVRIRAYKTVKGKTFYSGWSAVKTVKTK